MQLTLVSIQIINAYLYICRFFLSLCNVQVDKKTMLDNLELVLLTIDETVS